MCGRYSIKNDPSLRLRQFFTGIQFDPLYRFLSNDNVCPTLPSPVVLNARDVPFCTLLRWGLIPAWSREEKPGTGIINARSETVTIKPSFKASFRRKRCIVPADSFYEWKRSGPQKIPYRFFQKDEPLLLLAGIWDEWERPAGILRTFAILTTPANESMAGIHDRMPVILNPKQAHHWLANHEEIDTLTPFFNPQSIPPLNHEELSISLNFKTKT